MSRYPDYSKAPDTYILGLAEMLAFFDTETVEAMLHPLTGLATKCKFLPTPADVAAFVESRKSKFEPPPTLTGTSGYRRLNGPEPDPRPPQNPEERRTYALDVIKKFGMEKEEDKPRWQPKAPGFDISDLPDR